MTANFSSAAMVLWQDNATAQIASDLHLQMIFIGIIAVILVLVMVTMIGAGIYITSKVKQLEKRAEGLLTTVAGKANPIIAKTQEIIDDLQPKIRTVSENVTQMSYTVRAKVDEVGETVSQVNKTAQAYNQTAQDVNGKTRAQVERVNGIVTDALTATQHLSETVQHGIKVPVNKAASMIATAKTFFEGLADKYPMLKKKGPRSPYDF